MPISLTTEEVKYLKELVAAGERGRTIAAPSRREGLKRLVEAGYVVSRPKVFLQQRSTLLVPCYGFNDSRLTPRV